MNVYKWLLFDLSGVLVEDVGAKKMMAWMPQGVTEEDARRAWRFSPSVREFESGSVSPVIFASGVVADLGLRVHPDIFLREFPDFLTDYFPGALELLACLAQRYPLAVLANTNRPQWDKLCGASDAARLFKKLFLSFKTGYLKPDREAYLSVVSSLGCAPGEILLFDGDGDNVRGAIDAGIDGVLVRDFEDLKRTVQNLELTGALRSPFLQ